jgi:hypothetical protein
MRRRPGIGALPAIAMAAGCRTAKTLQDSAATGEVGMSMLLPPASAAHLELPSSQAFVFPDLLEPVPMPIYPADLLAFHLPPIEICMELDIDESGAVYAARPRSDDACVLQDDGRVRQLVEAASNAVLDWRYAPAMICATPDGRSSEDACAETDAVMTPTQLRLSYSFRFVQRDGAPSVDMSRLQR